MDHGFLSENSLLEDVDVSVDLFWPGIARLGRLRRLKLCLDLNRQTLEEFVDCSTLESLSLVVNWDELGDVLGESIATCLPQLRSLTLTPVYSTLFRCPPSFFHAQVWPYMTKLERLQRDLKDSVMKTREVRSELTERATQSVHAEAKIREVETELSVAQASTDLIATGVLDYSIAPDTEDGGAPANEDELAKVSKAAT